MLAGWKESGHPVRSIHELLNFIQTGTHAFISQVDPAGPAAGRVSLWKGPEFSPSDLQSYLGEDHHHLALYTSAMIEGRENYTFGTRTLAFRNFVFDFVSFSHAFRAHPAFTEISNIQEHYPSIGEDTKRWWDV
jgi:hypothetical protein